MKKYWIIFLFLSIFLSGCQKNSYVKLDFSEVTSIFSQQIDVLTQNINNLGFDGTNFTDINLSAKGENKDFKLNSKIHFSGYFDTTQNQQDIKSQSFVYFLDKGDKKEINVSGHVDYKKIKDNKFINLNNVLVDLGPGNYQGNLMLLISQNLKDKWISLDKQTEDNIFLIYKDIKFLSQTLLSLDAFDNVQTVKYESQLAYRIQIKPDVLEYINQNLNHKIGEFQGLFIVKSVGEVEFKIEKLTILGQHFDIKGQIGSKKSKLEIKNLENTDINYIFTWDFYKNYYNFNIKQQTNHQDNYSINLSLINKKTKQNHINHIQGSVIISPQMIYGSDLEKEIEIDINVEQKIYSQSGYNIQKPDSYMLFDQILGDEFSLSNLMSNEKTLPTN